MMKQRRLSAYVLCTIRRERAPLTLLSFNPLLLVVPALTSGSSPASRLRNDVCSPSVAPSSPALLSFPLTFFSFSPLFVPTFPLISDVDRSTLSLTRPNLSFHVSESVPSDRPDEVRVRECVASEEGSSQGPVPGPSTSCSWGTSPPRTWWLEEKRGRMSWSIGAIGAECAREATHIFDNRIILSLLIARSSSDIPLASNQGAGCGNPTSDIGEFSACVVESSLSSCVGARLAGSDSVDELCFSRSR